MRLHILIGFTFLVALTAGCSGNNGNHSGSLAGVPAAAPATPGRYVVVLAPGTSAVSRTAIANGLSNAPTHTYSHALQGFAGRLNQGELARLRANPNVVSVEPDTLFYTTAPGGGGGGGGGGGAGQQLPWGVDRIDAELNTGPQGTGVAVAVFDTGIHSGHTDLQSAVIASFDATGSGSADDGNGHGTHCAGVIGARDNSRGYVGVAPNCKLVAVKVLNNNGAGQLSWIVGGIDWAVGNRNAFSAPIRVGSMSFGGGVTGSGAMATAITNGTNAGIIFVASAGNNGADAANGAPGSFSNVICVSALDPDDTWASYSSFGNVVDVIAPGTNVPSLWRKNGYRTISGTSMACPHVSGCVALWLDNNYDGDPLNDHADDFASVLAALQAVPPGDTSWTGELGGDSYHEPIPIASGL